MQAHFTSRIEKICKSSSDETQTLANAMIKACKEAFPCLCDLRAHYLSAKMELEGLKENNNNNIWLLDFRQSIHSQLSKKLKKNEASCSEIVDLILSFCDNYMEFSLTKPVKTTKTVQGMLDLNKFDLKLHRLSETEISKWTTASKQ